MKKEGNSTRLIGEVAEKIAVDFLVDRGYTIIETNFFLRGGEIDIIAWHDKYYFGKTLCFVEVKYRRTRDGSAERAVGKAKQHHMHYVAQGYCMKHTIDTTITPIQFEQVSIYGPIGSHDIFLYEII